MNQINSYRYEFLNKNKKYIPKSRILSLYSKIMKSVEENFITFISSKTGSGKSTKVPAFLYEYLEKKNKDTFCVICSEPRTIACTSLCKYVQEQNEQYLIDISLKKYFELNGPNLLYLKESDLLYLLKEDPFLIKCDILIIDEVHERTMKLDLLLYYLKHFTLNKTNKERGFKLVFMSATFNTNEIYNYLSSINDQTLTFGFIDQNELYEEFKEDNYEVIYSNNINNSLWYGNTKFNEYNMGKLLREISSIVRYEVYSNDYFTKTILVFLPDYKSIYSLYNMLQKEYHGYINVYQFSSVLSPREQSAIIKELNQNNNDIICNVIIATTLAETCLTFPNCDVVIDCGLKKNNRYNYESNIYEEVIEYISQDSCIQRSGRCGRGHQRGKCYRLFSEESFNLMEKFRKPDIETGNIDLIILKLFETEKISKCAKKEVETKGYLDFLSKVEKNKFNKIVEKLIKYNAIENKEDHLIITNFGFWAMKANIDIELGYYFDKFKEKYTEDIQKEHVFQLLNAISITDNYNCELFYTDIDNERFQFGLIDNNKNTKDTKTIVDFSKNISNHIINQALTRFHKDENKNILNNINEDEEECKDNEIDNKYFKTINFISPYYYLYSKLDEVYSVKNFFTKNKIFQLGDWITCLYFINQYKLIKCPRHFYFKNEDNSTCHTCKISKYFYCTNYSLNEKYFNKQRTKTNHIREVLKFFNNENEFLVCKYEETTISKWNIIYLNLISKKPTVYINENRIIRYINELKYVNFEEIMNKLFEEFKKLYIDIATKYLELTKNDDEMFIQRKIFQKNEEENINNINNNEKNNESNYKIEIYFNKLDKVNLMKSYFFEFIPKQIDKYFCFTKLKKVLGTDKNDENKVKLSKLYFKVINPVFDEMINKSYKLKNHFEQLKSEIIDKKEIKVFPNIGKYFYYHFIAHKLHDKNIEIFQNALVYLYDKIDRDFNKEEKIMDLINNEKENYSNIIDSIQCLKGGCITIQLTQGLSVINIFDTYANKNKLLYLIKFNNDDDYDYEETKDNNYYKEKISNNKDLKYEDLIILEDKLIIGFKDSLQLFLFLQNQNLNLKLIPYKESKENILPKKHIENNNYSNLKIYIVRFELKFTINEIHKKLKNYMRKINQKYNCKLNYYIDQKTSSNSIAVYYYINSEKPINIPENEIFGEECKESLYKKNFCIEWLTLSSDYEYISKFLDFCAQNNLNVLRKFQKIDKNNNEIPKYYFTREYELINYSTQNMKLIQNYIGFTTITLNSFALLELKSKSKDTFLEYGENLYQYARAKYCNINITYYENKITIYGRPNYRQHLYNILLEYFKKLQEEKIIYSLKGKEDMLLLKTICKKVNQKQIVMLVSNNEHGAKQLEFRKKYFDYITELFQKKKSKNKKRYQIKSTKCEICLEKFDNKYNNNYFKLKLCGHKFCMDCLKMQISNSLRLTSANNIPIKCIKCNTIISNSDIFEIILPNTHEYECIMNTLITLFMLKNSAQANLNLQKKYYWCPNKKENCNYIYNSQLKEMGETNMTCPNCSCKICLICNDILDPYTPHNPNCQSKLYSQLSDKNRKWMLKNSKDCPMCHNVYEKNQGCNHMTCTICNPPTHFCYICGNILNDSNPLSHFNDKESKCNNKLWDDPKNNNINEEEIDNNYNNNENINEEENEEEEEEEDSKINDENYRFNNRNNFAYNNSRYSHSNNIDFTQAMFDRINSYAYNDNSNNNIYYKERNKQFKQNYNRNYRNNK